MLQKQERRESKQKQQEQDNYSKIQVQQEESQQNLQPQKNQDQEKQETLEQESQYEHEYEQENIKQKGPIQLSKDTNMDKENSGDVHDQRNGSDDQNVSQANIKYLANGLKEVGNMLRQFYGQITRPPNTVWNISSNINELMNLYRDIEEEQRWEYDQENSQNNSFIVLDSIQLQPIHQQEKQSSSNVQPSIKKTTKYSRYRILQREEKQETKIMQQIQYLILQEQIQEQMQQENDEQLGEKDANIKQPEKQSNQKQRSENSADQSCGKSSKKKKKQKKKLKMIKKEKRSEK